MVSKKIYLSDKDKMIAGVCGGLAEYFDIDPTIIRIIWFIATFVYGTGFMLYLAFWIICPREKNIFP